MRYFQNVLSRVLELIASIRRSTWNVLSEQLDFGLRMRRAGVPIKFIQHAALQYHLYHQTRTNNDNSTKELFQKCIEQNRIRVEKGLDQYL